MLKQYTHDISTIQRLRPNVHEKNRKVISVICATAL